MSAEKLDFSKPEEWQTRDGREVRVYATDGGGIYPIHGAILDSNEAVWYPCSWTDRGTILRRGEGKGDLVRKPRRVTGWLNMYGSNGPAPRFGDLIHSSQHVAKLFAVENCLGQIFVDAEVQVGE